MNCRQVEKRLPLYVSGDVGGRRGRRIGLHLEACPCCRAVFDAYVGERCRLREVRDLDRSRQLTGFYDELAARLGSVRRVQAASVFGRPIARRVGMGLRVRMGVAASAVVCAALVCVSLVCISLVWAWEGRLLGHESGTDGPATARATVIAEPGESGLVQPFLSVGRQRETAGRPLVIPATFRSPRMMILAGPRAAVPIVAPALPADPPIPRVQPYACPWSPAGGPSDRVH